MCLDGGTPVKFILQCLNWNIVQSLQSPTRRYCSAVSQYVLLFAKTLNVMNLSIYYSCKCTEFQICGTWCWTLVQRCCAVQNGVKQSTTLWGMTRDWKMKILWATEKKSLIQCKQQGNNLKGKAKLKFPINMLDARVTGILQGKWFNMGLLSPNLVCLSYC